MRALTILGNAEQGDLDPVTPVEIEPADLARVLLITADEGFFIRVDGDPATSEDTYWPPDWPLSLAVPAGIPVSLLGTDAGTVSVTLIAG